ncbi:MAG: hypothetical protein O7F76_04700 [Planctomycetota bacterium]|nr:hypothetical protein [Planctomycetota bacterium]
MFSTLLEYLVFGLVSLADSAQSEELIIQLWNPLYVVLLRMGL